MVAVIFEKSGNRHNQHGGDVVKLTEFQTKDLGDVEDLVYVFGEANHMFDGMPHRVSVRLVQLLKGFVLYAYKLDIYELNSYLMRVLLETSSWVGRVLDLDMGLGGDLVVSQWQQQVEGIRNGLISDGGMFPQLVVSGFGLSSSFSRYDEEMKGSFDPFSFSRVGSLVYDGASTFRKESPLEAYQVFAICTDAFNGVDALFGLCKVVYALEACIVLVDSPQKHLVNVEAVILVEDKTILLAQGWVTNAVEIGKGKIWFGEALNNERILVGSFLLTRMDGLCKGKWGSILMLISDNEDGWAILCGLHVLHGSMLNVGSRFKFAVNSEGSTSGTKSRCLDEKFEQLYVVVTVIGMVNSFAVCENCLLWGNTCKAPVIHMERIGLSKMGSLNLGSRRWVQGEPLITLDSVMVLVMGLRKLAQVSSIAGEEATRNVHSGGPPPWFSSTDEKPSNEKQRSGKSSKLNPKRVGAAWVERRKIKMEMEKRGETVTTKFDCNWLPDFGRVWKSGGRKESRKEFQVEINTSHNDEKQTVMPTELQPYVSK